MFLRNYWYFSLWDPCVSVVRTGASSLKHALYFYIISPVELLKEDIQGNRWTLI